MGPSKGVGISRDGWGGANRRDSGEFLAGQPGKTRPSRLAESPWEG